MRIFKVFVIFLGLCSVARLAQAETYTVTNTNDSGVGSLRQAVLDANANSGTDMIEFAIPGTGPHTIRPGSPLPEITDPVIIDGYTQAGSTPATTTTSATLMIELDGSDAGEGASSLYITAGSSTVRGLVINRFEGHGISLETNGNNMIEGNYIGTDINGTGALGNKWNGVDIRLGSSNNTIGGNTVAERNIISGNSNIGISISDSCTMSNIISGNYIGVDVSGSVALGNVSNGIFIEKGAHHNIIGGATDGERNIISGSITNQGVHVMNGHHTTIIGNFIGVGVSGTFALGNHGNGILVNHGAQHNVIGGNTTGARNIISGNGQNGVCIEENNTDSNVVRGNFIGTDFGGMESIPNGDRGVTVHEGASGNIIGGSASGERNIVSGNNSHGIEINGSGTRNNTVIGN